MTPAASAATRHACCGSRGFAPARYAWLTSPTPRTVRHAPYIARSLHSNGVNGSDAAQQPVAAPPQHPPSALRDFQHPVSIEQFRGFAHQVIDFVCDYYANVEKAPVRPRLQPGDILKTLPTEAPAQPDSFTDVMRDFSDKLMPGVTHWQHPHFFAWFSANSSFPGLLADMLIGALNMIGFSWASSPVSTELEMAVMDWLAKLFGLPAKFITASGTGGGVIQGTSSEAVLVALLAARARALKGRPPADALRLVAYASDQTHSCFKKACMIAGIQHVRLVPAQRSAGWAVAASDVEAAMAADAAAGLIPFYLCATIGTTSSCAVDPIGDLAAVAARHGAWTHVDAAYAGAAAVLPEMQGAHFRGLEAVDSYSTNPHKWLLTNFDCCAMWVADTAAVREALSLTPVFLQGTGNLLDYKDMQVPLGRRFRSLKLYFVLRMYGSQALQAYIRHHLALADWLVQQVRADDRFELMAEPRFALVVFRLRADGRTAAATRSLNVALLESLNDSGELLLTQTELGGEYCIRMAVCGSNTQLRHVQEAWGMIQAGAARVLAAEAVDAPAPSS